MTITLRQLEIFEKVATSQHVTQASEQLLVGQSAVSMAIAEMERQAGSPLFERVGKRLILNDRGRQILPQARKVLTELHMMEQFLAESAGQPIGTLDVGASTTIGNYILPAIVGEFCRRYPKAKALLHVANAQQVESAVAKGDLDFGLVEGLAHYGSLTATPWRGDELVVIVGKDHPWADERVASLDDLHNASWIMRERGSGTREIFEAAMARQGVTFAVSLELGHTEAIKKAVEAGLGVGCLSRMAVEREIAHGWLIEVASQLDLQRSLLILTRDTQQLTALSRAFLTLLGDSK
ncbi:LysR substrate-binding domain-containing protein [Geotalea sp. SG265]|uniref:LysR substrate-binding domain-containing protein n=1 Tax=Geotalea sp. SG265 TaxID=2922867 RepID=UPI001FAF4F3A|nr:LysR substrate-binding domain-containing protein [Geotalea sp. SG265]